MEKMLLQEESDTAVAIDTVGAGKLLGLNKHTLRNNSTWLLIASWRRRRNEIEIRFRRKRFGNLSNIEGESISWNLIEMKVGLENNG
jgi:hypothetical protein